MDREHVERIILEEIQALDESAFEDAIKKVKAGVGNLEKRGEYERRLDKTEKDIAARKKRKDTAAAVGVESLPENVVAGEPRELDLTNPPVLLDPVLMYQKFRFIWDYDVAEGKMPKKFKPGASSGAVMAYDHYCEGGLEWYCRDNWYKPKKEADPGGDPEDAVIGTGEPEGKPGGKPGGEPGGEPEDTGGAGADLPVPVWKKFTGKEREAIGMDKSSAGSLSSQLHKLFPDLDKKIVNQMLKDVTGQLKANGISVQESKRVIAEEIYKHLSLLNEKLGAKQFDVKPAGGEQEEKGDPSKDDEDVGKLKAYVEQNKRFYEDIIAVLSEGDLDDVVELAKELDLPAVALEEALGKDLSKWISRGRFGQAARDLLARLEKSKKYIAHELAKVKKYISAEKDPTRQKEDVKKALEQFISLFKGANQVLEAHAGKKTPEGTPEGTPEDTEPKVLSGDVVLDALKGRLKELDLDTDEGMYGASEKGNEQAYLGAYMFYKAMIKLQKALKANPNASTKDLIGLVKKELGGNVHGSGSPYSPKRTGPVHEGLLFERMEILFERAAGLYLIKILEGCSGLRILAEAEGGEDIMQWLEATLAKFKSYQLDDGKRAVAAARAARGAKGAGGRFGGLGGKDITRPQAGESPEDVVKRVAAAAKGGKATKADLEKAREAAKAAGAETSRRKGKAGTINIKQIVGPRLKQGGIDLAQKRGAKKGESPHSVGSKLQRDVTKIVRRFLRKNLQRIGKEVNLIAEQKVEDRLVETITNYIIQNKLYRKKII